MLFFVMLRQTDANLRAPQTDSERAQTLRTVRNMMNGPLALWWAHAKEGFAEDTVAQIDAVLRD